MRPCRPGAPQSCACFGDFCPSCSWRRAFRLSSWFWSRPSSPPESDESDESDDESELLDSSTARGRWYMQQAGDNNITESVDNRLSEARNSLPNCFLFRQQTPVEGGWTERAHLSTSYDPGPHCLPRHQSTAPTGHREHGHLGGGAPVCGSRSASPAWSPPGSSRFETVATTAEGASSAALQLGLAGRELLMLTC